MYSMAKYLLQLNQLDLKVEILSCQCMVGINEDMVIVNFSNSGLQPIGQLHLHAFMQLWRSVSCRDLGCHVFPPFT